MNSCTLYALSRNMRCASAIVTCFQKLTPRECNTIPLFKCVSTIKVEGAHELPLCIHDPSTSFIGKLKIKVVVAEVLISGDEMLLEHTLEATMQHLCCMLVYDKVFVHTCRGLTNDYRHEEHTCTLTTKAR